MWESRTSSIQERGRGRKKKKRIGRFGTHLDHSERRQFNLKKEDITQPVCRDGTGAKTHNQPAKKKVGG